MGKRRPSLDLVFSISRVSSSSLTQVLECSFPVVSRKAGHMRLLALRKLTGGSVTTSGSQLSDHNT